MRYILLGLSLCCLTLMAVPPANAGVQPGPSPEAQACIDELLALGADCRDELRAEADKAIRKIEKKKKDHQKAKEVEKGIKKLQQTLEKCRERIERLTNECLVGLDPLDQLRVRKISQKESKILTALTRKFIQQLQHLGGQPPAPPES